MRKMIRISIVARSLSGSIHTIVGRVEGGESVPYHSLFEALTHLHRIGWTPLHIGDRPKPVV